MTSLLYQPSGVVEICIPMPIPSAACASPIKQSLENIYKEFLKQESKPRLSPVQMSKSIWSNDYVQAKGKKTTLFPSMSNHWKEEKVREKTLPHLEGTHTGGYCTRRVIPHTLFPQGQQPQCVLPEARWLMCLPANLKPPCPWVSCVTWGSSTAVCGSFSWLHACHEFLRTHKNPHVQGYVQGHRLDDQGNFIS